jgi:hypothetical protein
LAGEAWAVAAAGSGLAESVTVAGLGQER